jgi:putative DNA primase/helicase
LDAVRIAADAWDPDPYLLACADGVIDLRDATLWPHDAALMMTGGSPLGWFDRTPEFVRDMPIFRRYLETSYVDRDGMTDHAVIDFLQLWCGYCLTGETREQMFCVLMGVTASGKGTLMRLMEHILGPRLRWQGALSILEAGSETRHQTVLADLHGRRVVFFDEVKDVALNTAQLKRLTGQTALSANKMHRDAFTFMPRFKPWLLTNGQPLIDEEGGAIWRRMAVFRFFREFTLAAGQQQRPLLWAKDLDLDAELEREAPAILRWMVEGARRWYALPNGLQLPPAMIDARGEFRVDQDVLARFVAEKLMPVSTGGDSVVAIFQAWDAFKFQRREKDMAMRSFRQRMKARGFFVEERGGVEYFPTLMVKQ